MKRADSKITLLGSAGAARGVYISKTLDFIDCYLRRRRVCALAHIWVGQSTPEREREIDRSRVSRTRSRIDPRPREKAPADISNMVVLLQ